MIDDCRQKLYNLYSKKILGYSYPRGSLSATRAFRLANMPCRLSLSMS